MPRTAFAVAVITGGVVALTTTLEIGSTPMPPLNVTSESLPSVDTGITATSKRPRLVTHFIVTSYVWSHPCGNLRCLSHLVCFANPYNGLFSKPVVVRLQAQTTSATEHDRRPRE